MLQSINTTFQLKNDQTYFVSVLQAPELDIVYISENGGPGAQLSIVTAPGMGRTTLGALELFAPGATFSEQWQGSTPESMSFTYVDIHLGGMEDGDIRNPFPGTVAFTFASGAAEIRLSTANESQSTADHLMSVLLAGARLRAKAIEAEIGAASGS